MHFYQFVQYFWNFYYFYHPRELIDLETDWKMVPVPFDKRQQRLRNEELDAMRMVCQQGQGNFLKRVLVEKANEFFQQLDQSQQQLLAQVRFETKLRNQFIRNFIMENYCISKSENHNFEESLQRAINFATIAATPSAQQGLCPNIVGDVLFNIEKFVKPLAITYVPLDESGGERGRLETMMVDKLYDSWIHQCEMIEQTRCKHISKISMDQYQKVQQVIEQNVQGCPQKLRKVGTLDLSRYQKVRELIQDRACGWGCSTKSILKEGKTEEEVGGEEKNTFSAEEDEYDFLNFIV